MRAYWLVSRFGRQQLRGFAVNHVTPTEVSAEVQVSYEYDEFGRLRSIGRLNGVKTALDFTGTGKLLNFNHDKINNANYEYNPAGQMVNRVTSSEDFQIKIPQPGKQEYTLSALNHYESINDVALSYDLNVNLTGFDGYPIISHRLSR